MTDAETLARYLCQKAGFNPDDQVMPESAQRVPTPKGMVVRIHPSLAHPLWVNWIEVAIAAMDYQKVTELPSP